MSWTHDAVMAEVDYRREQLGAAADQWRLQRLARRAGSRNRANRAEQAPPSVRVERAHARAA